MNWASYDRSLRPHHMGEIGIDRADDAGRETDHGTRSALSEQASRETGPGTTNATGRGGHEQAEETDNVGHDRAAPTPAGTDLAATEDADDYARVPGWADRR